MHRDGYGKLSPEPGEDAAGKWNPTMAAQAPILTMEARPFAGTEDAERHTHTKGEAPGEVPGGVAGGGCLAA